VRSWRRAPGSPRSPHTSSRPRTTRCRRTRRRAAVAARGRRRRPRSDGTGGRRASRSHPTRTGRRGRDTRAGIVREFKRLWGWETHHTQLVARLAIALGLSAVVDVIGALLVWGFERLSHGTEIHGIGDAFFFSTVQLLTVSSQLKNPLTAAGRVVDVVLEAWALFVVTGVAGSFAAFFAAADSG